MRPPLANEALCLSTPKHNGKSGTEAETRQIGDTLLGIMYTII